MLVIAFIVTVLYPFILKFIEKDDIKTLKETENVNTAINVRKKIKRNRIIILILMLILYAIFEVVTTIVFTNFEDPQNAGDLIRNIGLTGVAMYIYLRKQNGAIKAVGNISTYSKHDFLEQHNKYCLFLRGFEDDNYHHEPIISEEIHSKFSEYEFASLISQDYPICAVGMTKEVNSPRGATRVYLNDLTWKQDVLELMQKAHKIYILINDRESCIWEIEQSVEMLKKTTYIISDYNKYENARIKLAKFISFPLISKQKLDNNIILLTYTDDNFCMNLYENSINGYTKALGTESHELKKKSKSRKILQGCLIGIFAPLIIIIFITYLCVLYNYDKQDETYYTEESKTSNGFVENVLSSTSIPVDSLDFMIVYFNNDICHSYATKHFDNRTETDFNTFLSNERENINQSSLVFLLYDGSPNAFTAVQKAVIEKNNGYVRLFDAQQLACWYKFRNQTCEEFKYQQGNRIFIFDNYDGVFEVISCEFVANDDINTAENDMSPTRNTIDLYLKACEAYKREVIGSTNGGTLLLDVIPFDIKLFGVDIIKKNKTVPTRENLKLSLESYSTSFIMFELVSSSDSWGITTPLKEQLKGDYDVCVDIGADGDIRVSIINSHTAKLVFKTSLRNYY